MKKSHLVMAMTLMSSLSFAEVKPVNTGVKVEAQKTATEVEVNKHQRIVTDESSANREGKKYTVNATITGFSFGSPSSAIEAGYHISDRSIVNFEYQDLQGYDDDGSYFDEDGKGSALLVSLKHFTSNSFYVKPALYHRTQEIIDSYTYSFANGWESDDRTKFTDIGVSFTIGNQWQWENFTLGCDWIGITKSLSTLEEKSDNGYKVSRNDLTSANLLNFYIGASF
jgi:hypothetical protein